MAFLVTCQWSLMARCFCLLIMRFEPSWSMQMRAFRTQPCPASTVHRVRQDLKESLTDQCLS